MATPKTSKPQQPAKLLPTTHPMFWVSVFFQEAQALDALDAVHHEMHRRNRSEVVTLALCGAVYDKRASFFETVKKCVNAGLLLCCFDGTTALQGGAA